jgi:hypothetical protein
MYWTKNGSIPSQETDGTEGWQQAPSPPTDIPEGKELVWLNWEWIVRDPKPQDRAGYQWNWQHEGKTWVESAWGNEPIIETLATDQIISLTTIQLDSFTSSQITNLTTAQVI